jgi:hypothetical protein
MKSASSIKSSEVRSLLEAKRDQINLLLPIIVPSVGIATVERDNHLELGPRSYYLRIGEKIKVRLSIFTNFWAFIDSDGSDNFLGCNNLNEAIVRALPDDVRAEFRRKLNAG